MTPNIHYHFFITYLTIVLDDCAQLLPHYKITDQFSLCDLLYSTNAILLSNFWVHLDRTLWSL